jgi:hypothetical protein
VSPSSSFCAAQWFLRPSSTSAFASKQSTAGKRNKRTLRKNGTPAFPIHQAGYDAKAADAKPAAAKK